MNTLNDFLNSNVNDFSQVYYGKDNVCRCGCAGEYVATSQMKNARSLVNDEFVSEKLLIAKKMVMQNKCELEFDSNNINISYNNNQALTFYFDEMK